MLILRWLERMDGESKRFFLSVLKSKQVPPEDLEEALNILARTGVRENAIREAWLFSERAKSMLNVLPDSKAKRLLFELADYVVYRSR